MFEERQHTLSPEEILETARRDQVPQILAAAAAQLDFLQSKAQELIERYGEELPLLVRKLFIEAFHQPDTNSCYARDFHRVLTPLLDRVVAMSWDEPECELCVRTSPEVRGGQITEPGREILFKLPADPLHALVRIRRCSEGLDAQDLVFLRDYFTHHDGPWHSYGEVEAAFRETDHRIRVISRSEESPALYRPLTRSQFIARFGEQIDRLPPATCESLFSEVTRHDGPWLEEGRVTAIRCRPGDEAAILDLDEEDAYIIYQRQTGQEFLQRTDSMRLKLRYPEDLRHLIATVEGSSGPWNDRGLVQEISQDEEGRIAFGLETGGSYEVYPPMTLNFFFEHFVDNNPACEQGAVTLLQHLFDTEEVDFLFKGKVERVSGGMEDGVQININPDRTVFIFGSQSFRDFLDRLVVGNPLLSRAAQQRLARLDGDKSSMFKMRGLVNRIEESGGEVMLYLQNGHRVSLSEVEAELATKISPLED